MSDLYKEKSELHIARCQESKAHNDLAYCKKQAEEQEHQLAELLKHKEECVDGLKAAKRTGMTPLHIRELQVLLIHIKTVLETLSYKVAASHKNLDDAKEVWQEKNENFEKEKEAKKKGKKVPDENITAEDDEASTKDGNNKDMGETYYQSDHPTTMAKKTKKSP